MVYIAFTYSILLLLSTYYGYKLWLQKGHGNIQNFISHKLAFISFNFSSSNFLKYFLKNLDINTVTVNLSKLFP